MINSVFILNTTGTTGAFKNRRIEAFKCRASTQSQFNGLATHYTEAFIRIASTLSKKESTLLFWILFPFCLYTLWIELYHSPTLEPELPLARKFYYPTGPSKSWASVFFLFWKVYLVMKQTMAFLKRNLLI